MPYFLVQRADTIDLGRNGSKWRHGWIPLNASATAIKLKKVHASGGDHSAPGKSRLSTSAVRPSRAKLASGARVRVTPGQHGGQEGHFLSGRDTKGRTVRGFVPGERRHADAAAENVRAGKPMFDSHRIDRLPASAPPMRELKGAKGREASVPGLTAGHSLVKDNPREASDTLHNVNQKGFGKIGTVSHKHGAPSDRPWGHGNALRSDGPFFATKEAAANDLIAREQAHRAVVASDGEAVKKFPIGSKVTFGPDNREGTVISHSGGKVEIGTKVAGKTSDGRTVYSTPHMAHHSEVHAPSAPSARPRTEDEANAALKEQKMVPGTKVKVGAFTSPNPAFSEGASPDTHTVVRAARNGNVRVRHDPTGTSRDVAFERLSPVRSEKAGDLKVGDRVTTVHRGERKLGTVTVVQHDSRVGSGVHVRTDDGANISRSASTVKIQKAAPSAKRDPFTGETRMETLKRTATDLRARGASQSAARHRREMRQSANAKAAQAELERRLSTPAGRADEKAKPRAGSTIMTSDGHVIAQTRHVDISGTKPTLKSAADKVAVYDPEAWRKANSRGNAIAQSKIDAQRAARAASDGTSRESIADVGTRLHGADRTRWKADALRTQSQFGDTAAKNELARRVANRAAKKAAPSLKKA